MFNNILQKNTFSAAVLATIIFLLARPFVAKAIEGEPVIIPNGEIIREPDEDKISQIFLLENGIRKQLSDAGVPSVDQAAGDRYAVWMSQHDANWQIHAYDLRLDQQFQLTFTGNNVNPQTSDEFIVWEGQVDGLWRVFLFDGVRVKQISEGNLPVQDLLLEKNFITFLQKDTGGQGWIGFSYDTSTQRLGQISQGQLISELKIHRGIITWKNQDGTQGRIETSNKRFFPNPTPPPTPLPLPTVEEEEPTIEPTDVIPEITPLLTPTLSITTSNTPSSTATPTTQPTTSTTATPTIIEEPLNATNSANE